MEVHHTPMPGEIPVPHGVQDYTTVDGRIVEESSEEFKFDDSNQKQIFAGLLHPEDSYTEDGTYWADLPFGQRVSFITKVDNAEAKREFGNFWKMFKNDPLSPVNWYFSNCVLPGAGLLLEGYVLFSIGNVSSLFQAAWPACWKTYDTCSNNWIAAVTYLEIVGIIVGQVLVGFIGDGIGRRWGLIQDAIIMFVGLIMLTASWGTSLQGWVICYAWSLFFYSIGVGGEYPMTATSGMEKGTRTVVSTSDDRLHRGRKVLQAFLMQGWGQFFNQTFLILLLIIFHHGSGNPPYSAVSVQWTFRIAFAIPAIGTLWLVYFRTFKMAKPSKELEEAKKKANVTGYDVESLKLILVNFGPRLLATAGSWFANDVFFYGNKLFQSNFINVISPNHKGVMLGWLYSLVNIGVSLAGYYLAAFFIDNKLYGRNIMMQVGFLMCFVLFVVPAFHFAYYRESVNITKFQTMYFLSSFFNQFGPNAVTFLVAAEVFPTSVRATAHGFSAACGKAGALLATVLYNYISDQTKFYFVPWFGLLGMILTFLFLPDTTGLDLMEQDRRWDFIRTGRSAEYHGIAIHPRHLSLWERMRGVHKNYNPELDYQQRVEELRKEWTDRQTSQFTAHKEEEPEDLVETFGHEVHNYFVRTTPVLRPRNPALNEKFDLTGPAQDI
ncbi:phosphate transporter PHO84 [Dipodascopsis uninucleata]